MQQERFWRRLAGHEANGDTVAARALCQMYLQTSPSDVGAWLALGAVERARGAYRAARKAALAAADAAAGGGHPLLAHVGVRLLDFDCTERLDALLAQTDWTSPDVLRQAPSLLQQCWLLGRDADVLLAAVLARKHLKPSAEVEYICGLAQRDLGDIDAATSAFERAVTLRPDFAAAHWSLAYMAPVGEARIPRLRAARGGMAANSPDVPDLHYALFREYEKAGDVAAAWRELERGMVAKRALLPDIARRIRLDELPDAPARALPQPDNRPAPVGRSIFVVGMPRTGTTVLERILGNHSRLRAAGELNDVHTGLCMQDDRFVPWPNSCRGYETLRGGDALASHYREHTARWRAHRDSGIVDKNPANFAYSGVIAEALPEARIICLVKDPMDACFSNLKELFSHDAYPYSYGQHDVADYYAWFDRNRKRFEQAMPGRFLSVQYRDLVADPVGVATRVLEFCGLSYESGCERIEANRQRVSTASSTQVREPIHGRSLEAWTKYADMLEPLRERLRSHGYDT